MTGVAVGLGSAARSTSRTSKRKSRKIGIFRPETNIIATPYKTLSRPCRAPNLLESKFDCPGFFRPSNKTLLSPFFINAMVILGGKSSGQENVT